MPLLVRLEQAGVDLGGRRILDQIDLELRDGSVLGLTGPNGSGKTTLLRTLATLLRIDRGSGAVLGADINSDDVYRVRPSIGLIGHSPLLLERLTLRENLTHAARLAGLDPRRVEPALHSVGLDEVGDRLSHASSFGMKRRLEVARLLLTRPKLLLLDEAMAGLDSAADSLMDVLIGRTLSDQGGVVVASHDLARLSEMCDEITSLSLGRLEELP